MSALINTRTELYLDRRLYKGSKTDRRLCEGGESMSDCIFCKMVHKEIPVQAVYEDDEILAFKDINPLAPVHILLIPKKHISDTTQLQPEDAGVIGRIYVAAVKIAREMGIDQDGFRIVNNCKDHGGQEVFHLHFHLLGGRKLGGFGV